LHIGKNEMKKSDMKSKSGKGLSRRGFLGSSAVAGVATLVATTSPTGAYGAEAQANQSTQRPVSTPPSAERSEREVGMSQPPVANHTTMRASSDLMVQVLRDLEIEYVASNPGSSFEGLQESIINYGETPNVMPEFISALHEESAVDMAHGYARAEGRPMVALVQGTVGLQHASMAIYQAFHGHVPMIVLVGNDEHNFVKAHTGEDMAALVRPYTKWDAHPSTLEETLEALQEGYRQSITPPCAPVLIVLDSEIQKQEAGDFAVPAYSPPEILGIDKRAADEIAQGLVNANNPHISVGRFRTPEGVERAIELAELVGASTDGQSTMGPMSFPQRHPLSGKGVDSDYDYILGLEFSGRDASIRGPHLRDMTGRDDMGLEYGWTRSPAAPPETEGAMDLAADAEASLPMVIDSVQELLDEQAKSTIMQRSEQHANANYNARVSSLEVILEEKKKGWNSSPVSLARLYAELWPQIKDHDWCLASPSNFSSRHHADLWDHDKPYSYLGVYPASALGYCIGACTGAALAAKERKRIVINIQGDGDLNYAPGALWTAAHHRLPMLTIMHNNRAWHMELMYLTHMAGQRGRGTDRAHIGTTFRDPYIDYAKLAAGYGVASEGPISDPNELAAAYQRGIESVLNGEPYLIDVLTQPR
jgi:thiamine pyrophosphate-dependent acetolactate synthase large subunit-like protein